ncbi:MAG: hypothetical protein SVT52_02285 [Planctomycetota bacterium]|nr:hypothetical protein [Planctomycetota bacterium]
MIKNFALRMSRRLKALHRDEQGADMVEYILVIAAVALPLLLVVIWFWKDISKWVGEIYEDIRGGSEGTDPADL